MCLNLSMSTHFQFNSHSEMGKTQDRLKVTDLISRLNEEKKIEKKKKFGSWCSSCFCSHSFWNNTYNLNQLIFAQKKLNVFKHIAYLSFAKTLMTTN
jgi:hypothetical protein